MAALHPTQPASQGAQTPLTVRALRATQGVRMLQRPAADVADLSALMLPLDADGSER
jgi:hypothetical protein